MKKHLTLLVSLAGLCAAQSEISVRGQLKGAASFSNTFLSVELYDPSTHRVVERAFASTDGSFEILGVERGFYELRVTTQFGEVLTKMDADIRQSGVTTLSVPLPEQPSERPAGASVSVAELRHRPPKAAWKAVVAAQKRSEKGDYAGAADYLRKAIRLDPNYSVARTNLGAQLIRLQKPAEAEVEFRKALELDAANALNHSNLAFALLVQNRLAEAEPLARKAVKLDNSNARTRCVLGYVLARRPEMREEAMVHLRFAANDVPQAGVMLGQMERMAQNNRNAGATRKGWRAGN